MKTCRRCGETKPAEGFSKRPENRDGLHSHCKACRTAQTARYAERNPEKVAAAKKAWYEKNVERLRAQARSRMQARRATREWSEYMRQWREQNRDKVQESWKRHGAKHLAARRARLRRACPMWDAEFDDLVFREAYALAKQRAELTGFAWHVDHVVPLKGKNVCGLHNGRNVQVVPAAYNLSKNNRFDQALLTQRPWL